MIKRKTLMLIRHVLCAHAIHRVLRPFLTAMLRGKKCRCHCLFTGKETATLLKGLTRLSQLKTGRANLKPSSPILQPVLLRSDLLEKVLHGRQEATDSEGSPHRHPCMCPVAALQKMKAVWVCSRMKHPILEDFRLSLFRSNVIGFCVPEFLPPSQTPAGLREATLLAGRRLTSTCVTGKCVKL